MKWADAGVYLGVRAALIVVASCIGCVVVFTAWRVAGVGDVVVQIAEGLRNEPQSVEFRNELDVTMSQSTKQKTGKLRKTVNGTEVEMDYVWDCTPEGWQQIRDDWKFICENPPNK